MIRSKGWLVCGLLLSSLLLAACAAPLAQDDSFPGSDSAIVDVTTLEPTAMATIANTPAVTPSPLLTVTLERTVQSSPTPEPTETYAPKTTPEPTATSVLAVEVAPMVPTATIGEEIGGYKGGYGYINEIVPRKDVEALLQSSEYDNSWPLKKDSGGDYSVFGILTNHQRVHIELPDGHVVELTSEFFYRDINDDVQMVMVPLFMQSHQNNYGMRFPNANIATETVWTVRSIETGLIKHWWYLDTENVVVFNSDVNFKRSTLTNWRDHTGMIGTQSVVHADHYLPQVLDGLGIDVSDIEYFANTGIPDSLPSVEGQLILIPNVILAPTLEK